MQDSFYFGDDLKRQVEASKPLLLAVIVGLALMLLGLRIMPEGSTPLTAKVMGLFSPTAAAAAAGAYAGRNLRGWLPVVGLLIASVVGVFILDALGGSALAIPLLVGWGFVNGMMLGPLVAFALAEEGPQVVMQALVGTAAVMTLAGLIVFATGVNFNFLMPLLFAALMGLVLVGLVGVFVRFSRAVNLTYSALGMAVFAGYFLMDFFRASRSENTWQQAVQLTTRLYLNFANYFVNLLQFLLTSRRR